MKLVGSQSGRSENGVSFLTYFRFPSSHTTVRAVRHTAVSCLSCPFWTPHIGHRHFFSIVGIRPIVLKREFLFGHLTTTVSKYTDCPVRQCTIRPFALTVTRSATSASADSSTFVVTIHGGLPRPREISHTPIRDKIAISFMLREIHEFSSHAIRHELYIKNRKRLFCP